MEEAESISLPTAEDNIPTSRLHCTARHCSTDTLLEAQQLRERIRAVLNFGKVTTIPRLRATDGYRYDNQLINGPQGVSSDVSYAIQDIWVSEIEIAGLQTTVGTVPSPRDIPKNRKHPTSTWSRDIWWSCLFRKGFVCAKKERYRTHRPILPMPISSARRAS